MVMYRIAALQAVELANYILSNCPLFLYFAKSEMRR